MKNRIHRFILLTVLQLAALSMLFPAISALAANYYVGNDSACDFDRITVALFNAAFSADPNPVFYISKDKPAENAEISLTYAALQTAEFRGGYNSCQDAINGVTPSGRSAIHSNALATSANRRTIRVGGASTSPVVKFYDIIISGGRLDSTVIPDGYGAGLFVHFGTAQLFRTEVQGNWTNPANTQSRGGGVAVIGSGRALTMDEGTVIHDNVAHDGGGIYCANSAVVLMEGSDVRENSAVRGGGLHITNGCNAPLTSTSTSTGRVRSNSATLGTVGRSGGGIYVGTNSLVEIIGSSSRRFQVTGNSALAGGGARVFGNNALLSANWADFDNNNASGGGLHCEDTGSANGLVGQNIRIRNNSAGVFSGGGVIVRAGCSARLHNGVTISGNSSGLHGGGVFVSTGGEAAASLTIEGGTQRAAITNNNAANLGGGAAVFTFGGVQSRLNLDNVEVSSNSATFWGGGLYASNTGAEIIMRRTLAGNACHSEFYCSDLSFNSIHSDNRPRGAAAAARDGGFIEIGGTYVEGNEGTAIRANNLTSGNAGSIRIFSSVLVPAGNNRLVHAEQGRVAMYYNTIDHATSTWSPVTLVDGNGGDRRSYFFGNLFNGSTAPVLSPGSDWFATGPNGGCSGFSQTHSGNNFFSSHPAARRYVGDIPLMSATRLISDPMHPIIDFCDSILDGNAPVDILGHSRPFETVNDNTHGTWDLGAHEIRPPPFHTLTASRSGEGGISSTPSGIDCPGTCQAQFAEGTSVQVTATPEPGWGFSHWDGNCSGTHATCNVTLSGDRVVVARFVEQFNLNVFLVGDGSVNIQPDNITCTSNCTEVFNDGTSVTLTATADAGYTFASWTGACTGTGPCDLEMTTNRSVAAEFVEQPSGDVLFQDRFQD